MKLGIREMVFLLLLISIPLGSWWFIFRPNSRQNSEMLAQIELRQKKLQQLNRATATLGDLKMEIRALEDAIRFFGSKLPSEKEMDKVLREVWRLAEANRLTTKSIRTAKGRTENQLADPAGPYAEQPVSMKLEGSFRGFYGFLLALEAQPRIMRLRQMKIEKPPRAGEGCIKIECEMSVFFERAGKES